MLPLWMRHDDLDVGSLLNQVRSSFHQVSLYQFMIIKTSLATQFVHQFYFLVMPQCDSRLEEKTVRFYRSFHVEMDSFDYL
jgi:hypothetical protein